MFNEFAPLENTELRKGITRLAGRSGIEVGNVLVMDASRRTSHTNAYFTGLGRTKRVVLYDTLVENHTEPEVLCVVAHEIGHWKCSHICKGYFIGLAGVLIALLVVHFLGGRLVGRMPLGARDLASPATMPLVFLSGAFYPVSQLPPPASQLAYLNPLVYGVDLTREALTGLGSLPTSLNLAALLLSSLLLIGFAAWSFNKATVE